MWYRQLMQWNGDWVLISGRQVSVAEAATGPLQRQAKSTRSWLLEQFWYWNGSKWELDFYWMYPSNGSSPIFGSY